MNIPELKKIYIDEVAPALLKSRGLKNVHQVPKIEKVVLNSSFGAELDKNGIEELRKDMTALSGQAPIVIRAKMSVSNFKLREGMPVGIKVTLRGNVMWDFLLRLIAISLPNIRDFRGLPFKSFDGRGNYAVGFPDQAIFPEIELDQIKRQIGFDFIFVTSAKTDAQAKAMLKALGMPFRDNVKEEAAA